MKFGKSIRAEARNNRGLSFINFKYLKRILKRCGAAVRAGAWDVAKEEDSQFCAILESELRKVGESYWKELQQISHLQAFITQKLPLLDIQPDPETYTRMGFEQLQAHLQSLGGLGQVPPSGDCSASSVKTSAALCEFCVNLGKISARCKRLRRCVLWNAVAVVKILKKRQKHTTLATSTDVPSTSIQWECHRETAVQVLSRQDWYCCDQLPKIVSIVETTTDELMQHLTLTPPNRDQYQCPICLDVVVDPVCLRTCGHRFCWACLCMAYCEKPEGTLERCPCCRAAFPLDPEAFEVDGILSRFLRDFFPEDQTARVKEQKENLRQRLEVVQRQQEEQQRCVVVVEDEEEEAERQEGTSLSAVEEADHHHCCPDCIVGDHDENQHASTDSNREGLSDRSSVTTALFNSLTKLSLSSETSSTLNGPLIRSAAEWLNSQDHEPTLMKKQLKGCRHEFNVKQGKPSDVDHLAFTTSTSSQGTLSAASSPAITFSPQLLITLSTSESSSSLLRLPQTSSSSSSSSSSSPIAHGSRIRSVPSTTSCASYTSSTSHTHLPSSSLSCIHDGDVIDSVVAALLCETPPRNSSPSPRSSFTTERAANSDCCPNFPLLPEIIGHHSADENNHRVVDDLLSECFLPSVLVDPHQSTSGHWMSMMMGTCDDSVDHQKRHDHGEQATKNDKTMNDDEFDDYYYEAVDDDDDRIEEEYHLSQRQQQSTVHADDSNNNQSGEFINPSSMDQNWINTTSSLLPSLLRVL